MNSKFIVQNGKMSTLYPETGDAMFDLIEDFYAGQYNFAKSAGAAIYTTDRENGYTNAIYGKYITAGMFMSDNVFTALGAKPYQHEGVRIATEMATYGLATADDINNGLTGYPGYDRVCIGCIRSNSVFHNLVQILTTTRIHYIQIYFVFQIQVTIVLNRKICDLSFSWFP